MKQPELVQRWRERRDRYRPAHEVIDPRAYEVAPVEEPIAKAFVTEHHYSGSYPAGRFSFGLYRGEQLVGAAVFSHPCNDLVLTNVFPGEAAESTELGRFVLLDSVPGNGETWFLARCFEQLRRSSLLGVLSFSDPVPRTGDDGRIVFPGHLGVIYQAHNAVYLGRGTARTLRILPDGSVLNARAMQKVRAREQGWEYVARTLVRHGAPAPFRYSRAYLIEWLETWIPKLTRPLRHPGNHRYAWALNRSVRLPAGGAYPKHIHPGGA